MSNRSDRLCWAHLSSFSWHPQYACCASVHKPHQDRKPAPTNKHPLTNTVALLMMSKKCPYPHDSELATRLLLQSGTCREWERDASDVFHMHIGGVSHWRHHIHILGLRVTTITMVRTAQTVFFIRRVSTIDKVSPQLIGKVSYDAKTQTAVGSVV
jgi:hypothetical protein